MKGISLNKARRLRFAQRQNPGAIIEWLIYLQPLMLSTFNACKMAGGTASSRQSQRNGTTRMRTAKQLIESFDTISNRTQAQSGSELAGAKLRVAYYAFAIKRCETLHDDDQMKTCQFPKTDLNDAYERRTCANQKYAIMRDSPFTFMLWDLNAQAFGGVNQ